MEGRHLQRLRSMRLLAVAGIVLAVGCHTITEESPTEPSPVSDDVVTPISIPVVFPEANATPTPTPDPVATPTPDPEPTPAPDDPGPTTSTCSLPASNPRNAVCVDDSPQLDAEVDDAIDRVVKKKPGLFDLNNKKCSNCYYVNDIDTYAAQVVKELGKVGLCALWDGEEITVKEANSRSEQYDIILASGHIRRIPGAYRGSCRPALF